MTEEELTLKCRKSCLPYYALPAQWREKLLILVNETEQNGFTALHHARQHLAAEWTATQQGWQETKAVREELIGLCEELCRQAQSLKALFRPENDIFSFSLTRRSMKEAEKQAYIRLSQTISQTDETLLSLKGRLYRLAGQAARAEEVEISLQSHAQVIDMAALLCWQDREAREPFVHSLSDFSAHVPQVLREEFQVLDGLLNCCEQSFPGILHDFTRKADACLPAAHLTEADLPTLYAALTGLNEQLGLLKEHIFLQKTLDFSMDFR